ncbi:uncharacterized protein DS421_4g132610 [Arachis hypogaea]|nr:uncharacterized protein DS421_4g132610 [Arachis hypogaea]
MIQHPPATFWLWSSAFLEFWAFPLGFQITFSIPPTLVSIYSNESGAGKGRERVSYLAYCVPITCKKSSKKKETLPFVAGDGSRSIIIITLKNLSLKVCNYVYIIHVM